MMNKQYAQRMKIAKATKGDSYNPLLRIAYKDEGKDPDAPTDWCRLTIDHNASGDSKLAIFLDIGASSTDYSQYQFTAKSTGVSDPNGVDASPTHTQCTTLGALIKALRAVTGIRAYRLDAPADYSLNTDDFITAAAVQLGPMYKDVLYKDASEILTISKRLWIPEGVEYYGADAPQGSIEIIKVRALANSDSDTDCDFSMHFDPDDVSASDEVDLGWGGKVTDSATSATTMLDFSAVENGKVFQGPILFEITAATSMADGAWIEVQYRNADL